MYLISIYFDEKTNATIKHHMERVAECTGNTFMLDGNVPPHITICALESMHEEQLVMVLEQQKDKLQQGSLNWVSVGTFLPQVIYLQPVLNQYLQQMAEQIYQGVEALSNTKISPMYQPFNWLPHSTVGKTLSKEQLQKAFIALQNSFVPFQGEVVKIGLAKTNPYTEIRNWVLEEKDEVV